jgi:hypothetical protein
MAMERGDGPRPGGQIESDQRTEQNLTFEQRSPRESIMLRESLAGPLDQHIRGSCSPASQSTIRPPPNDVVIWTKY